MELINGMKAVNSGLTQKDESTIASTDLVQLYAQDGTPNGKISKADLMDAVKASLPALLSDQTTTADNVLTLASNALGKSTVANLASVLGGKILNGDDITDVNSIPSGRTAYIYGQPHAPNNGYWLIQSIYNSEDGAQIAYSVEHSNVMTRRKMNNSWTNWMHIDNFGCNTPADLASLLGVMENKDRPSTLDLNEIREIGFYLIQAVHGSYINKPSGAKDYGALLVFCAGGYIFQIWINDTISDKMYIRGNWGNSETWYAWREIALTPQT